MEMPGMKPAASVKQEATIDAGMIDAGALEPVRKKLSSKIVGMLVGFLALALAVISFTLLMSWQLEGSAAAINDSGSLRMQSYRLNVLLTRLQGEPRQSALESAQASALRAGAGRQLDLIDAMLLQLSRGDPRRPLFLPATMKIQDQFAQVRRHWQERLRPMASALLLPPTGAQQERAQDGARDLQPQVDAFVDTVNVLVHLIEQDSEQRTFWLRASQLALLALALVGTVSVIYLLFLLIIEPLTRLGVGMARMKEKDFSVRLEVQSADEFGQLAQGFNQMADRLQALYGNLEARVHEKTAALEDQNRELALLYDCAAFLQHPQPVADICEGFMQRISGYFKADGASVRVLDADRGNLHLVVQHGLSAALIESEHCLKVGDCLCGAAVAQKVTVVHDLRRIDSALQLQCHRDGFATVSIFHIHAQQQHLGFFNLHFRQSKIFNASEQALLETLGQLLGVAIENLRLGAREREMAISEERNLVAQGLHDSIAQGLNYLNLQVQMLDASLQDGKLDEVVDIVPALHAGVQESYEDVRELLLNFRSRLGEGDLLGSLQSTVEKFRRQSGIAAELVADLDGAPFPREQQLQMVFIVQEALSNVRKHAQATRVEVTLEDHQDFILTIRDNGIGFDSATRLEHGGSHIGLHIMRERAERISARLDIDSTPGEGTTIVLQLSHQMRRAA
jgi:two-component system nitrate/nitrite sensor histidine kinase NarX